MRALSDRLSLIASMVKSGSSVCDVGTDHGYLPAFLYLSGISPKVCATDIRQKPLNNARENLKKLSAQGVRLLLCDGLCDVTRDMADTVIIAGMGGTVISGIMERCAFLPDSEVELVLQPMTAASELRLYLAQKGYEVLREEAVAENSKIYSVMKVRYNGAPYDADPLFLAIGRLGYTAPAEREYINKQYRICKNRIRELEDANVLNDVYKSSVELALKLEEIMG